MAIAVLDDVMLREPRLLVPGQQPVRPVKVDVSNKIARALVCFWGGPTTGNDLVNVGAVKKYTNATTFKNNNLHHACSGSGIEVTFPARKITKNGGCSTFCVLSCANVTDNNKYIFSSRETNELGFRQDTSNIYAFVEGTGINIPIPGINTVFSVAFVNSHNVIRAGYLNGLFYSSVTAGGVSDGNITGYGVGALYRGSGTEYPFSGSILLGMMFNRVLSPIEIFSLHNDPYQFLIPA